MRELDTEVAEAAERWLSRPGDVEAYGQLVAAVARRRNERLGAELAERGRRRLGDDGTPRSAGFAGPAVTASPPGSAHDSRRVSPHGVEHGDPQAHSPVSPAASGPPSRPDWRLPTGSEATPAGSSGPATPVTSYGRPGPASYPVLDALPPTAHGVPDPGRRDHETTVVDLRRGPSGSLHLPDDPDMPPILAEMMRAQSGRPQGRR